MSADQHAHRNAEGHRADADHDRLPVSERACDGVVLGFALWTVCAHAVVASGGGVVILVLLYAIGLAIGLLIRLGRGSALRSGSPPAFAAPGSASLAPAGVLSVVTLAAGLAVTLSYAWRPDPLRLWWSSILLLGLVAGAVWLTEAPRIERPRAGPTLEGMLWLLAVACAVLALVAHRPDADDAFYVNVGVAVVDVPGWALLSGDTLYGIEGLPLALPSYRVQSYELWNGALAYLTGIPAIYVFHWLSAAVAALLVPLASAKLFRLLTPRWWLWSVGVLTVVLVAAGDTHRWYGNFAFVRIWQGKSVFLSVFVPLIYAYGLRFGIEPTLRGWGLLSAAQIAAVGCSATALWAGPVTAALALLATFRPSRESLRTVALGVLSSAYVLGAAWVTKNSLRGLAADFATVGGPSGAASLHTAFVAMLGDSRLLLFGIAALLLAGPLAPPGLARRFAAICPLAVFLGLLNPYVTEWIKASLIGPLYWRGMWVLPVPILMTLVLTSPLRLGGNRSWIRLGRVLSLALVVGFALLVPRYSGLSAANNVQLGWPRLKVPESSYRWAAIVNRSVPAGAQVAAPPEVAAWIVTFHHHAHPLRAALYFFEPFVGRDDAHHRLWMQAALATPELVDNAPRRFRDGLDRFHLQAVCLANSPRADTARRLLAEAGFHRTIRADDYELWLRPDGRPSVPATSAIGGVAVASR